MAIWVKSNPSRYSIFKGPEGGACLIFHEKNAQASLPVAETAKRTEIGAATKGPCIPSTWPDMSLEDLSREALTWNSGNLGLSLNFATKQL